MSIPYIDIHTHHDNTSDNVVSIINGVSTAGLHPWFISPNGTDSHPAWEQEMQATEVKAQSSDILMIGETGIDLLRSSVPLDIQELVFMRHAALAESVHKPLIIHCVKAHDIIIRLHRTLRPAQPWIVHGFRGKPQQAEQLLSHNIQLSFGKHFNPDSMRLAFRHHAAWLETDDTLANIEDIYQTAAGTLNVAIEVLKEELFQRFMAITPTFSSQHIG